MKSKPTIRTVLFDLDGTLADTAPDLTHCLNLVRNEHDLPELSLNTVRPAVSHGATALIELGFEINSENSRFDALRSRLLELYLKNIAVKTNLFEGMHELLENIESKQMNWGIVTNKPKRFTNPLVEKLGIAFRASCVISGDSIEYKKPHPMPITLACQLSGSAPSQCVYVGDAKRDIIAGKAAGTKTLVALFGYIHSVDRPSEWGADGSVNNPLEIMDWINEQCNSTKL